MSLSKPTLCACGCGQVLQGTGRQRYFNAAHSSPKEIYYVRDAGHIVPIDNGWDDVVRQIDGFIRECPVASGKTVDHVAVLN